MARRAAYLLLLAALFAVASPAGAHRLAPSLLELREVGGGRVEVRWKTPLARPSGTSLRPVLPRHCVPLGQPSAEREGTGAVLTWAVECGESGLVGASLRVDGLDASRTDALLRVELADGRMLRAVLGSGVGTYVVPERAEPLDIARDYLVLGVEHILGGIDHLLFVFGLVLLVRRGRTLAATVTAFTAGHSVTLSLAALGFVAFPTGLVELAIAGTLLVLALELCRDPSAPPSALRRRPWAMAFGFGLLHGLGFAGALSEVGLPLEEIPAALLAFNIGIELGQLLIVVCVLVWRWALGAARLPVPAWLRRAPAYTIGTLAAFYCWERAVGLL